MLRGFERLGTKYGVKIIYDAAHAFGVDLATKNTKGTKKEYWVLWGYVNV